MKHVLIADRGTAAVRITDAWVAEGISTVAVYADQDFHALHVRRSDEAYALRGGTLAEAYANEDRLMAIALRARVDAVHPGFGPLAESASFARRVISAGLTWVGASPETLERLSADDYLAAPALPQAEPAEQGSAASRRIEVHVIVRELEASVLGDCDVSLRRRNEAFVAQSPAPSLTARQRAFLHTTAQELVRTLGEPGVFRVAFAVPVSPQAGEPFGHLCGITTRLDFSHAAIEESRGLDLVREQLRIALRPSIDNSQHAAAGDVRQPRSAIAFRILAEDAGRGFLPCSGWVSQSDIPGGPGVRWDAGVKTGDAIPSEIGSDLGTLVVSARDRATTMARAKRALRELEFQGVVSTVQCLRALVNRREAFEDALVADNWVESDLMGTIEPAPRILAIEPAGLIRWPVRWDGSEITLGLDEGVLFGLE